MGFCLKASLVFTLIIKDIILNVFCKLTKTYFTPHNVLPVTLSFSIHDLAFFSIVCIVPGLIKVHHWSFILPILSHSLQVGMALVDYSLLLIVVSLVVHSPVPEPHLL